MLPYVKYLLLLILLGKAASAGAQDELNINNPLPERNGSTQKIEIANKDLLYKLQVSEKNDSLIVDGFVYNYSKSDLYIPYDYCAIGLGEGINNYPGHIIFDLGAMLNAFDYLHTVPYLRLLKRNDSCCIKCTRVQNDKQRRGFIVGFDYLNLNRITNKNIMKEFLKEGHMNNGVYKLSMADYENYSDWFFIRVEDVPILR